MEPITTKDLVRCPMTIRGEPALIEATIIHVIDLNTGDSFETISVDAIIEKASGQMILPKTFEASAFRDLLQNLRNHNHKEY